MARLLSNTYEPADVQSLSDEEVRKALTDFDFLTSHCMQIVDKGRHLVPFALNRMQKQFFEVLLPMIDPKTRINERRTIVWSKPRQGGGTTGLIACLNDICSYVEGMENTTIVHTLPVTDTISKLCKKKVEPIITAVHPDIFPNIERETMSSSIMYHYTDLLGVRRNNFYEIVSANANSIRSDSVHIWVADESAWYKNPEALEDIISGAQPDYGFSLTIFISTYGEKNDFFKKKMQLAMDNPETQQIVFTPWFYVYPEHPQGKKLSELGELNEYEKETIIPAFQKYDYPEYLWGDAIDWYRRRRSTMSHMQQEFPTTVEELMAMGENRCVFPKEQLDFCDKNIEEGTPYTIVTDALSKEVKAIKSDDPSNFTIFRVPRYGHKYRVVVDPILSQSESSDFFALSVFDISKAPYEQVAVYMDRNLSIEDYADMTVAISKLYNRAEICPEKNIAEALVACMRALHYYSFFYEDATSRAKRIPGVRTTATSKPLMIDKLLLLLNQQNLILHDQTTVDQMRSFEKKEKQRLGGTTVKLEARKGHHDDMVSTCFILAGSLSEHEVTGKTGKKFSIL